MRLVLLSFVFSCSLQFVNAAINPIYKECSQRSYTINGDYCVFPDSTQCLLTAFNKQECGQQWFTTDYCVEEGQYVWDTDKCCEGLFAYLPANVSGQTTCQKKSRFLPDFLTTGPSLWVFALVIAILFGLLILLRSKSKKRKP